MKIQHRLMYYIQALNFFKKLPTGYGLCYALSKVSNSGLVYTQMEDLFPELWEQRPAIFYDNDYWWDLKDTQSRINALEAAIKIVQNKLSKNLDN